MPEPEPEPVSADWDGVGVGVGVGVESPPEDCEGRGLGVDPPASPGREPPGDGVTSPPGVPVCGAWRSGDGVRGDPRRSSAELGQLGVDLIVARTVDAMRQATVRH